MTATCFIVIIKIRVALQGNGWSGIIAHYIRQEQQQFQAVVKTVEARSALKA